MLTTLDREATRDYNRAFHSFMTTYLHTVLKITLLFFYVNCH